MIVAVTTDLLVAAPIEHAARQRGLPFRSLAPDALGEVELDRSPTLVLLDLTSTTGVAETVRHIRTRFGESVPVVAFGPHVHVESLQAAREAGCDQVLTRGQFHQQVMNLVANTCNR